MQHDARYNRPRVMLTGRERLGVFNINHPSAEDSVQAKTRDARSARQTHAGKLKTGRFGSRGPLDTY